VPVSDDPRSAPDVPPKGALARVLESTCNIHSAANLNGNNCSLIYQEMQNTMKPADKTMYNCYGV
jgi:hypothetical protein